MSHAQFPGHALRERREELGYKLSEIYERVHVPVEYVRAFEEGRIDKLPAYTYAVGFLSSYCQFLDLDPELYVDRFRGCTHRQQPASSAGGSQERGRHASLSLSPGTPQPAWLTELIAWGTICAILLLCWVSYSVIVRPFAENAESRVEAGQVERLPLSHFEEEDD